MTDTTIAALADNNDALDPLGDADEGLAKNRAKVGSAEMAPSLGQPPANHPNAKPTPVS